MLRKIRPILAVAIGSSIAAISSGAIAQQLEKCHMVNSAGEYIDLSSLCNRQTTPKIENNNSAVDSQPREIIREEVSYPKYDVRTYYDYGFDRDSEVKFTQPYFRDYRSYELPAFVPYYGNYYHPREKFGIGYSNSNFGIGFGYNFRPKYRQRSYYQPDYAPYRDRHGSYYHDRNGVRVRFR